MRASVRIRYRQPLQEATLFMREGGLYILFDNPQRSITPGQFAAWYIHKESGYMSISPSDQEYEMLGSGVIDR